ncbi:MAG: phage minor tail protein L [Burkholderiaceae bacterium]|nr:phage minor tail protein L [Burkholderiaceae bacterium]
MALNLARLEHGAVIELYELDATMLGGEVLRFHAGRNGLGGSVVWQGLTYEPFPIECDGFELAAQGPMPRPTLRVANVFGLIGVLVRQYKGLKGARLTRRRTLAKYLDAVNFEGGVNPSADPLAHYPDDVYQVDRQSQRDRALAVFELASPMDVAGVMLPRRQIVHGFCPWIYRGPDCGYTGAPVAKEDDSPTALLGEDKCGHRLSSCRLRQWPNNELSFGGFPGAGVVRNV